MNVITITKRYQVAGSITDVTFTFDEHQHPDVCLLPLIECLDRAKDDVRTAHGQAIREYAKRVRT